MNNSVARRLRQLPSVQLILSAPELAAAAGSFGGGTVTNWARAAVATLREEMLREDLIRKHSVIQHDDTRGDRRSDNHDDNHDDSHDDNRFDTRDELLKRAVAEVLRLSLAEPVACVSRMINASGTLLHTGLGRAALSERAIAAMVAAAHSAAVELDPVSGLRRPRGFQLEAAFRHLTSSPACCIVNNNAAATVLALAALARGREVVISRGQLIEIGGSFRLPEIFTESGAILREVGTTNRTTLRDYAAAIGPNTAAILVVHPSNFAIVGFTHTPTVPQLRELATERGLLLIDDIGSGSLVDTTRFQLPAEPTFQKSLAAGADLTLGSGDKLLGGPQCGILLGKGAVIEQLQQHPLARSFRIDKLTLAALGGTLKSYLLRRELDEIPILQMLSASVESLQHRATAWLKSVSQPGVLPDGVIADVQPAESAVGGGSLPSAALATACLRLTCSMPKPGAAPTTHLTVDDLATALRTGEIAVLSRVAHNAVWLDPRSVLLRDDAAVDTALQSLRQRFQRPAVQP